MTGLGALAALIDLDPGGDGSWRDQALCAQTDPEAFFPEKGGTTRDAKRVCAACPVRAECLADALARGERFGIWGGLAPKERRALSRQPAPAAPVRRGGWSWTDQAARDRVADLTARGWTPEEVAAEIGVSVRTVYRIQARQRLQAGAA